jgi:hypothetical protein
MVDTASQPFQTCDMLYASLTNRVHLQASFVACQNHVILSRIMVSVRIRDGVESEVVPALASLQSRPWLKIEASNVSGPVEVWLR